MTFVIYELVADINVIFEMVANKNENIQIFAVHEIFKAACKLFMFDDTHGYPFKIMSTISAYLELTDLAPPVFIEPSASLIVSNQPLQLEGMDKVESYQFVTAKQRSVTCTLC